MLKESFGEFASAGLESNLNEASLLLSSTSSSSMGVRGKGASSFLGTGTIFAIFMLNQLLVAQSNVFVNKMHYALEASERLSCRVMMNYKLRMISS